MAGIINPPNFFIIGAPKCGTTALSEYLRSHPKIFMSDPKEPHYFAEDLPQFRAIKTWEQYLQLFNGLKKEQVAIGEASVHYLYSSVAVPNLLKRFPDAKLIVMLRNPLELAPSMHAEALYSAEEDNPDFEEAWHLCSSRRSGEAIPATCSDVKLILYDQIARLGAHMQRLLKHACRAHVKWFFLEDMSRDPRKVYCEALSFIGVDDDGRSEFPVINGRKKHRSKLLGQFVERPPSWLPFMAEGVKRVLFLQELGVIDAVRRFNTVSAGMAPLGRTIEDEMRAFYTPDVELLQEITGRNLSHWLARGHG